MVVLGAAARPRPEGAASAGALRARLSLYAARAMREGSLRRFVTNRVSAVAIAARPEASREGWTQLRIS
jgi:hypothetical protein